MRAKRADFIVAQDAVARGLNALRLYLLDRRVGDDSSLNGPVTHASENGELPVCGIRRSPVDYAV